MDTSFGDHHSTYCKTLSPWTQKSFFAWLFLEFSSLSPQCYTHEHGLFYSEMILNSTKGCILLKNPIKVIHPKFLLSILESVHLFLHPRQPSLNFAGSSLPVPVTRNPLSPSYTEQWSLVQSLQIYAYISITLLKRRILSLPESTFWWWRERCSINFVLFRIFFFKLGFFF